VRTTVEISDAQRAKLLELAASRGEKGFSTLVGEAIELYLLHQEQRAERLIAAGGLRGVLSEAEGEELAARCAELRGHWR